MSIFKDILLYLFWFVKDCKQKAMEKQGKQEKMFNSGVLLKFQIKFYLCF